MSGEIFNTKEVAQYLDIHEKQVYALIKAKRIPATRVTGKWIFPKKLIDDWIETNAKGGMAEARKKGKRIEGALLAAGSNDPILDILNTFIKRSYPELYLFSANIGSTDGLKALNQGYTDLAWSHLLDPKSGEYNTPFLSSLSAESETRGNQSFLPGVGIFDGPREPPALPRVCGSVQEEDPIHQPPKGFGNAGSFGSPFEKSRYSLLRYPGLRQRSLHPL